MDAATLVRHALEALRKPLTLKEALSSVTDFRIDRKKKYPLYEILMTVVCAMIDGAKGPAFGALRAKRSSNQQPVSSVQWRTAVRPLHCPLCCWLLVVGTLRPQAVPKSAWSSPSCATRAQGRRSALRAKHSSVQQPAISVQQRAEAT